MARPTRFELCLTLARCRASKSTAQKIRSRERFQGNLNFQPSRQNLSSVFPKNLPLSPRPDSTWRGVWPIAADVGAGCDGRAGVARRAIKVRTAKSRGPDAPTLASSPGGRFPSKATGAIKPGTPGRSRISRNTIAQGMPVDPAKPVVTAACVFCCRRAMGEAITRHSLRPPYLSRDNRRCITRAFRAAGTRSCVLSAFDS